MKEELIFLSQELEECIRSAQNTKELEEIRIKYLSRKGKFPQIIKKIKTLPKEEVPYIGKLINQVKYKIENIYKDKLDELTKKEELQELEKTTPIDVTLPPTIREFGKLHPITQTMAHILDIFTRLGFSQEEGPEIETLWYNFDALCIPQEHPARDLHDTFYIDNNYILRTHTSPVQIRVMQKKKPPLYMIAAGKVYRRDADIRHSPMFHQVEGLAVDEEITFAQLKGALNFFVEEMFGERVNTRFRPSFFPFTEPSAEMDISCMICNGSGCKLCGGSGWLEILGAGMVKAGVFENVGYDPQKYQGFAFGMGVERIAMIKYKIDDIRLFFENDLSFLKQF